MADSSAVKDIDKRISIVELEGLAGVKLFPARIVSFAELTEYN
jgi:hypothetical protein